MPRLRLLQSGIQKTYASQQTVTKVCFPITPAFLMKLKEHWIPHNSDRDIKTHGSESQGQEEAGLRDEPVSYLQVALL